MNGIFLLLGSGRWPVRTLKGAALLWLLAEVLAFALALKVLGFGMTILAMFGTSLLGVAILRRTGLEAARQWREVAFAGRTTSASFVDGTLTALGAALLILPGFVSDVVGLALASPSIRQAIAARVLVPGTAAGDTRRSRPDRPDVIDLAPEDWRVVDKAGRV